MKTRPILNLLLIISFTAFGQVNFEKGYFINNDNQRTECLIKNYDWKNNPKEIEYKLNENDEIKKAGLTSVKEFGFPGYSKYIRADVKIDCPSIELSDYSTESQPVWKQEQLFLKTLIEGKASLYYYEDRTLRRFFYSVGDSAIQQLIYKEYLAADDNIATNSEFRRQLWVDVRCSNTTMSSVKKISYYDQKALKKHFIEYNECAGNSSVEYNKKKPGEFFNLSLSPGINYSALSISNTVSNLKDTDFGNKVSLRIGLEAEAILPFMKSKWSILFEPTYQRFISTGQNNLGSATINYSSIEFPTGIRYYLFLNKDLKLFINALYIPGFSPDFNSTISFDYPYSSSLSSLDIKTRGSFAIGIGMGYSRLSSEIRYYSDRDIFSDYKTWYTDYQRYSLVLKFKLL